MKEKKPIECPLSREEFRLAAKGLRCRFGDKEIVVDPKEFGSGSLGWFTNEKFVLEVGGIPAKVQATVSVTLIGSKNLPKEDNDE